mmetsp:Transcript_37486/g.76295  ORF Transcript_37486/g.76295 Transcript_37486/m.76295 type:complete len:138 (+) Transcript_37486:188-601(+)
MLGYMSVPGCKGGENVKFGTDYCVNPVDVLDVVEPPLTSRTHETVQSVVFSEFCGTGVNTCLVCMGNCNRNEDVSSTYPLIISLLCRFTFMRQGTAYSPPLLFLVIHSVLVILSVSSEMQATPLPVAFLTTSKEAGV